MSVNTERTGTRPDFHSTWHRENLPDFCYAFDLDMVEIRYDGPNVRIAGLFEYKSPNAPTRPAQLAMMKQLAVGAGAPAFIVYIFDQETDPVFMVKNVITDTVNKYSNGEYKEFIKTL